MRKQPMIVFGLAILLVALGAMAASAVDVPYLQGRVTDDAEILSREAAARIAARLEDHERRTTDQVAVLTVAGLEGESIENYALQVFEAWQLGRKERDNGVLLVVAPRDRRMRIEVGYGLEGRLTDLEAGRIVRNVMAPRFKDGDFDGGIEQAVAAIVAQLEHDDAPAPAATAPAAAKQRDTFFQGPDLGMVERILIGCFIFGIIGLFTFLGVVTPGMGWFLYFFLIPFWAMFPVVVVGSTGALTLLIVYLVCFPIAKILLSRTPWYGRAKKNLKRRGRAAIGGSAL
ncbi:MAG TPA: TPM domain-containing protein, partial [Desulfosarcina sp.]|nr:TPM domain-containing protein [Desulfosarcina sp.]